MKIIATLIAFVVFAAGLALLVIYSGVINVAATQPDNTLVRWALSTASDRSIRYHAQTIKTPALTDAARVKDGFHHYREMCVGCHGAPGLKPSDLNKGLNPKPPKLAESAKEFSAAEIFWVLKNGIKMTGMPAWGSSHKDDDLWDLVAFVKQLPEISPQEYQMMEQAAASEIREHGHNSDHQH
jgi:mono/diheme cytochrome c family protein